MQEIKEKQNFNNSGFNDDSVYSEEETKRKSNRISRFLIKSQFTDSVNSNHINNINNDVLKSKTSNVIESNNENYSNSNMSNTENDIKSSINSEEEDNLEIKMNNELINNNQENNELSSNLIIPSDDNLIFTFKNKLSKLSTPDEIFRDTIKISMNRTNKFNTSKLARIFTYEEKGKNENYILKSKKFGISRNNNIITYILNLYIFSEFTNLDKLEKDSRFKLYFLPISQNRFDPNYDNILNNLNIKKEQSEQFIAFINGINILLNDREYNEIQKRNKKYKICLYITNIFLFLFIAGIIFCAFFFYSFLLEFFFSNLINKGIIIVGLVLTLILIILFIFQIIKFCKKYLYIIYNNLNYMLINYTRFNDYIEEWNKNFFEKNKIRVSIPISLNYIMFNLDPYQDIEIKHLDMKWFIEKVYKDKKSMTNDKEFIKYFIKVRSTLVDGNNNNYYESI